MDFQVQILIKFLCCKQKKRKKKGEKKREKRKIKKIKNIQSQLAKKLMISMRMINACTTLANQPGGKLKQMIFINSR